MTEEKINEVKKQTESKEVNKKKEIQLPHLNFGYLGTAYIHTEKGMCLWMTPSTLTLEESVKYLKYTMGKYEDAIVTNKKKKEEEEELKPAVENKKKNEEFKPV